MYEGASFHLSRFQHMSIIACSHIVTGASYDKMSSFAPVAMFAVSQPVGTHTAESRFSPPSFSESVEAKVKMEEVFSTNIG